MRRLIVAMSGASGQVYGRRLLQVLSDAADIETHLIISSSAGKIIAHELGDHAAAELGALADRQYDSSDLSAPLASGSCLTEAMVIAPCSVKTLAAIANGYCSNLITRAADVMLKERRRLLLMLRETPLHLGHIENMAAVCRMGGILVPPIPAFYHAPRTIDHLIDHSIGKVLDLLDIPHQLFTRWEGLNDSPIDRQK